MKSKLNKQQKKYIKACDSKELRKELKRFFILENLLSKIESTPIIFEEGKLSTNNPSTIQFLNNHPIFGSQISREEFEKINGKGIVWSETNSNEINEKFNEATKKPKCFMDLLVSFQEQYDVSELKKMQKTTETPNANTLTKETLESLTNPDLIEKKKDFEDCIENHLIKVGYCGKVDWDQKIEKEIRETLEFDLPKTSHDKGKEIEKDALYFISNFTTRPETFFEDIIEMSKLYDSKILKEFAEYSPPAPNKVKKYTEEDMLNCFNEAREHKNFYTSDLKFDSFASYLNSLKQ